MIVPPVNLLVRFFKISLSLSRVTTIINVLQFISPQMVTFNHGDLQPSTGTSLIKR